ncbi:MAG: hypothetical protein RIS28_576 [Bacteroidota bacterium]
MKENFLVKRLLKWVLFFVIMGASSVTHATHLVGGFLTYKRLGANGTNTQYRVTIFAYRDCSPNDGGVPFDNEVGLCVYNENKSLYTSYKAKLISEKSVDPVGNTACPEVAKACLKQGVYEVNITLPNSTTGYHLKWERCCRNTQNNLVDNTGTPYQGQTYYGYIPPSAIANSSPSFLDLPVPFICAGDTTTIRNRVLDIDGDSLSYKLVTPWQGGQASWVDVVNCQDPMTAFDNVQFVAGYSAANPFGAGGVATVDAFNGLTTYMSPSPGRYAVAIEVTEWRNGIAISWVRLDLQIMVITCGKNNRPTLQFEGGSPWYVEAGETICKKVTGMDLKDTQDVITLKAYGDILTGTNGYKGTKATFSQLNSARKTVSSTFCWTPDCNLGSAIPYRVTFEAYDNACPSKFVNQNVLIYVKPFSPVETIKGKVNLCQNTQAEQYEVNKYDATRTYTWSVVGGTINGKDTGRFVKINWGNTAIGKITVTIKNKFGCSADIILQVNLVAAPNRPVITGKDTVCLNQTSTFTTPKSQTSYQFTVFGGVLISSAQVGGNMEAKILWNKAGSGYVTVMATNSVGCNSIPDTFNVYVSSPVGSGVLGPTSVCPNNRGIIYTLDKKLWKSTYVWSASGSNASKVIADTMFSVDWGGLGTGIVQVVVTDRFGCRDTSTLSVKKNHALTGQAPQGPSNLCELSLGVGYKVNPVKGETYAWSVNGGSLTGAMTGISNAVNWGLAGSGWVGVVSTAYDSVSKLPCLSPLMKLPVVLNGAPKLAPLNDVTYCQSSTPLGYWVSNVAGVKKYEFDFSGLLVTATVSADSSQWQLSFDRDTFGVFPIKIRAISVNGCPGPWVTAIVTLHPKPKKQLISGVDAVCMPNLNGYGYSIVGLAGSTFDWSVNGGSFAGAVSPSSTNVTVDWTTSAQPGFVQVIEISDKGCLGDTLRKEVYVDNSSIDLRWISIAPPPNSDANMWVRYELLNGSRNTGRLDIERRPAGGAVFASVGNSAPTDTLYIDNSISPDATAYEYRVSTKNLCGDKIYSSVHTSVLLKGVKTGPFTMNISFSDYLGFANGISKYELYRALPGTSGFQLYQNYASPTTDNFNNGQDNYQQIFRIKAYELGSNRVSWSNDVVINFEPVVFIPNAFTPNENNKNEVFLPYTGGLKTFQLAVYNRWGERIFESSDPSIGWDGTVNGKMAMEGVYVYDFRYSDFKDRKYQNTGTLHLIR